MLGISLDGVDSHAKFTAAHGPDMTLLADTDGVAAKAFDVLMSIPGKKVAKRGYFLIDSERIIRYKHLDGFNLLNPGGGDPYEWSPVKKPGEMKELPTSSQTLFAEIDKLTP